MSQAFVSDWKENSVTVAALKHLDERIDVAAGQLRGAAADSTDPKVHAANAVLRELEMLRESLKEGRF